jgi:hypothetical protein
MTTMNIGGQPSPSPLPGRPKPPQINLWPVLILACFCLCLYPGCLALPIPQGFRNIEREGKKIDKFRLNFVVPGETTKAEFIEQIGQPYLVLDDLGVMAYYWKMLDAYVPWVVAGAGYGAAAGGILEMQSQYLLLVSYDDQGVINNYEIIRQRQTDSPIFPLKTVTELARQWAAKMHHVGNIAQAHLPADNSAVYVFHRFDPGGMPPATHFINGVFLDGNLWTELQWGQYTSIVVSPGSHAIGFERDIRTSDKFLHPDRQAPEPSLTTTIDVLPNQAYFLEICFIERDSRDFKKTPIFSRLSEDVARPKLAGLQRAK